MPHRLEFTEGGRDMPRQKRKLTAAEKRARRERKKKYMTIFINGKQKQVPRPQQIDGLPVDEFHRREMRTRFGYTRMRRGS